MQNASKNQIKMLLNVDTINNNMITGTYIT